MKKLLLVVVTWMALAGVTQADESRAGDVPSKVLPPEQGMATLVAQKAQMVVYHLAGRALGSLVRNGMTEDQIERILGRPDVQFGGRACRTSSYVDLGIFVTFKAEATAAAGTFSQATRNDFSPLFE